ncbi:zinc ABC transporter substrate-binding protein ZnuA [Ensifer soli]|uniref:zinc ABC transporter substrate-binding protein ZnuA n=1 Tax=Ciceribacter sp. sgz301302 TaxID=3342379 RepID=UPI0035B90773
MKKLCMLLLASCALGAAEARAEAPNVVVSIKPIHSVVASIMQGVGEPALIVDGGASPHTYTMKPSNAAALQKADVIFWLGPSLEAFLTKPLAALGGKATEVALSEAPALTKLPFREGGAFEAHDHGHEGDHDHDAHHDGHDHNAAEGGEHAHAHDEDGEEEHEGFDMHLWLDPKNAAVLAAKVAETLETADPANAARYHANLDRFTTRLETLDTEIRETIAPVKDKPFIVFHDAYQYFEKHFGVRVAGSITVSPETMPGAERISEIHAKVKTLGATCVFAEPQFEPKLVKVVTEGTSARAGVLDPEGGTLTAGPDLYFELMDGLATSLKACLAPAG